MRNVLLAGIVLVIVIAGISVYRSMRPQKIAEPVIEENRVATNLSENSKPFIEVTPDISSLQAGGNSYRDTGNLYTFLYPNDYVLDGPDGEKRVRIYKRAETQRSQSEMSDGVLIVLEPVTLAGRTLEAWVDRRIQETPEVVAGSKKATVLNDYPGFTYTTSSFGSSTSLIIQKDAESQEALLITYSVQDPRMKKYQNEVDAILTTIVINK